MTTLLYTHPACLEHDPGRHHPESPARLRAVLDALADPEFDALERGEAPEAALDDLLRVHPRRHVEQILDAIPKSGHVAIDADTVLSPASGTAALRAAGAVAAAVDAVVAREADNAFCAVRPPGHHAEPDRAMGFCLFNNVSLAARYAQRKYGTGRALIVDWDVHHGNGTQDIFYEDGSVFFFSTHQWPLYPGTGRANETGAGAGEGATMNFPLPAGSGRAEVLGAVRSALMPAMEEFRPELVLISAGFDSRAGDPLGRFTLTDEDFADLTRAVMEVADRSAGGRVVSTLEGGYSLTGLASAAAAHVGVLLGG